MTASVIATVCWPLRAAGEEQPPAADANARVPLCLNAAQSGQTLRDGGMYRRAREAFIVCAGDDCPGEVRKSCAAWLTDLEKITPTVVFVAQANGIDIADVRVSVDGETVAERVEGKPVPLDPGEHRFRFEHAGEAPVERTLVVHAGEKDRPVTVSFGAQPAAPAAPVPGAVPTTPAAPSRQRLSQLGFYVVGALGVASFAAGLVLDSSGFVFLQQCGGDASCTRAHELAEVQWRFVTGDVLLAAGVATAAAAWVLRPEPARAAPARATTIVAVPTPGVGAALALTQRF
jgi:hypothetical protein